MVEMNQTGDVLIGGEVTAEDVEISIQVTQRRPCGIMYWCGSFQLPDDQPRRPYAEGRAGTITLQDGRSRQVIFEEAAADTGVIQFQGDGPLE